MQKKKRKKKSKNLRPLLFLALYSDTFGNMKNKKQK